MYIEKLLNDYYEYLDSDEELEYFIRMNAEWNDKSFRKFKSYLIPILSELNTDAYFGVNLGDISNGIERTIGIISNNYFLVNASKSEKYFVKKATKDLNFLQEIIQSELFLKYNFFYGFDSPLSQWYQSQFEINGIVFNTAEQWMMYSKAILFNDNDIAAKILRESAPNIQRKLGKLVKDFDENIWVANRENIVYKGNFEKFTQDNSLKEYLINTTSKYLAEASPTDLIWGIGYSTENTECYQENLWRGKNLLGHILMKVRKDISPK
jgi:ribA/ribD-fused uncharacterized protein